MDQLAIFGGRPALERPIGYGRQYIDDDDIQAVVDVLKSDYLTCGPKIAEAEEKLCRAFPNLRQPENLVCALLAALPEESSAIGEAT